eukprot:7101060-Alexandrium_andersonii.AAC.1
MRQPLARATNASRGYSSLTAGDWGSRYRRVRLTSRWPASRYGVLWVVRCQGCAVCACVCVPGVLHSARGCVVGRARCRARGCDRSAA